MTSQEVQILHLNSNHNKINKNNYFVYRNIMIFKIAHLKNMITELIVLLAIISHVIIGGVMYCNIYLHLVDYLRKVTPVIYIIYCSEFTLIHSSKTLCVPWDNFLWYPIFQLYYGTKTLKESIHLFLFYLTAYKHNIRILGEYLHHLVSILYEMYVPGYPHQVKMPTSCSNSTHNFALNLSGCIELIIRNESSSIFDRRTLISILAGGP
ncbi:hypothetical protein AGLY_003110 [Aphis glycines]|uniref:Uncharacterized protein n=1 Tax=Aphis glycines TaxID=307491 RepID=A0A6G0U3J6_APHGL|nr:hypothetical protein AGLY_003110 [Aphis glycines]